MAEPSDAPPSYDEVAGSSSGAGAGSSSVPAGSSTSHKERNGIPPLTRRSMEDEGRPLPYGWIRQYDPENHHQFFVNTNVEPPKSIWHHPYDDEEYMNSLDPSEKKKIQRMHRVPSEADIAAESSDDDEGHHHSHSKQTATGAATLPPRPSGPDHSGGVTKWGRERQRIQRAEEEQRTYQRHMELRQAMSRAAQTGQPQFVGKDRNGKDVYIEPPQGVGPPQGAYGYNPYQQGPYANPNATFIRPQYPYSRPYGGGYGGGFGLPLAGGLMGGLLLGDMMGGGMMGGF